MFLQQKIRLCNKKSNLYTSGEKCTCAYVFPTEPKQLWNPAARIMHQIICGVIFIQP